MRKVVIKTGTLSGASTLHARRRRANDNITDMPMAAGAEICGAYTPVTFDDPTVVHGSRNPATSTVVRRIASNDASLVSNNNHPGGADETTQIRGWAPRLWSALWREWSVKRAASKLETMSDRLLNDIGVQRGDIDYVVRFGRPMDASAETDR